MCKGSAVIENSWTLEGIEVNIYIKYRYHYHVIKWDFIQNLQDHYIKEK